LKSSWKTLLPAVLITGAAAYAGHRRGLDVGEMARGLPAVCILLAGFLAFARPEIVALLSRWIRRDFPRRAVLATQVFLLPYLLYSWLLDCFSPGGFVRLLLYLNLPMMVLLAGERWNLLRWADGMALLLVWLPLELRLLGPLWPWPPGQSGHFLFGLLGVCLAVFLFVVTRDMKEVGYTFSFRGRDLGLAVFAFALFAPVATGIGLLTGFLHPARHLPSLLPSAGKILGIFLASGVPEELLFRGLLQNLVLRWTSSPAVSVALASVIFGAAHLNNGPHADARYFLLATLAGVVYGLVYRRSGTLMAPAMTHTLVNSTWALFFRG